MRSCVMYTRSSQETTPRRSNESGYSLGWWRKRKLKKREIRSAGVNRVSSHAFLLAGDQIVDVAGDAGGFVAVHAGGLGDREHLIGQRNKGHRHFHLARHVEGETDVLGHPGLARFILAADDDFHDPVDGDGILL